MTECDKPSCKLPKMKRWHKGVVVKCLRQGCRRLYVARFDFVFETWTWIPESEW